MSGTAAAPTRRLVDASIDAVDNADTDTDTDTDEAFQRRDHLGRPIELGLDANECVGGPPLPIGLDPSASTSRRYPDRAALERTIAARAGVDPHRIVATAGADDAIDRICRVVLGPGATIVLTDPTFPMFRHFAEACGAGVREVPWLDGPPPIAALAEAARGADLLAIATPGNPTGLECSVAELHALRKACPDPTLLLDLAYVEFAGADRDAFESVADACRGLDRTVIARTLSKAWGLAGLRVGWADAAPEFAARIRAAGGPFPIAGPSLAMANSVLRDPAAERVVEARVRAVASHRTNLRRTLESAGLATLDGRANFLLVSDPTPTTASRTAWLADGLAATGIAVRRFEGGSIADRVRVTVPVGEAEAQRLDAAIRATRRPDALLFDLDGVLADVSGSYRAAILATARAFGVAADAAEIERIKSEGDANDDWEVTRRLLAAHGVVAPLPEIVEAFQRRYLGDGTLPGLREAESCPVDPDALAAAVGGRPIGIVTGRPRAEAEWFLARSGLDRVVDTLVAREDAPLKPDPAGIVAALDHLGAKGAWFLGDTVDDLVAARAAISQAAETSADRCVVPIGVRPPGLDPDRHPAFDRSLLRTGAARVTDAGDAMLDLLLENLS